MGIRKRYWYTVECNCCGDRLEDYAGNLGGFTGTKERAEEMARGYYWEQIGKNT